MIDYYNVVGEPYEFDCRCEICVYHFFPDADNVLSLVDPSTYVVDLDDGCRKIKCVKRDLYRQALEEFESPDVDHDCYKHRFPLDPGDDYYCPSNQLDDTSIPFLSDLFNEISVSCCSCPEDCVLPFCSKTFDDVCFLPFLELSPVEEVCFLGFHCKRFSRPSFLSLNGEVLDMVEISKFLQAITLYGKRCYFIFNFRCSVPGMLPSQVLSRILEVCVLPASPIVRLYCVDGDSLSENFYFRILDETRKFQAGLVPISEYQLSFPSLVEKYSAILPLCRLYPIEFSVKGSLLEFLKSDFWEGSRKTRVELFRNIVNDHQFKYSVPLKCCGENDTFVGS
jgi:hypothetical protein